MFSDRNNPDYNNNNPDNNNNNPGNQRQIEIPLEELNDCVKRLQDIIEELRQFNVEDGHYATEMTRIRSLIKIEFGKCANLFKEICNHPDHYVWQVTESKTGFSSDGLRKKNTNFNFLWEIKRDMAELLPTLENARFILRLQALAERLAQVRDVYRKRECDSQEQDTDNHRRRKI